MVQLASPTAGLEEGGFRKWLSRNGEWLFVALTMVGALGVAGYGYRDQIAEQYYVYMHPPTVEQATLIPSALHVQLPTKFKTMYAVAYLKTDTYYRQTSRQVDPKGKVVFQVEVRLPNRPGWVDAARTADLIVLIYKSPEKAQKAPGEIRNLPRFLDWAQPEAVLSIDPNGKVKMQTPAGLEENSSRISRRRFIWTAAGALAGAPLGAVGGELMERAMPSGIPAKTTPAPWDLAGTRVWEKRLEEERDRSAVPNNAQLNMRFEAYARQMLEWTGGEKTPPPNFVLRVQEWWQRRRGIQYPNTTVRFGSPQPISGVRQIHSTPAWNQLRYLASVDVDELERQGVLGPEKGLQITVTPEAGQRKVVFKLPLDLHQGRPLRTDEFDQFLLIAQGSPGIEQQVKFVDAELIPEKEINPEDKAWSYQRAREWKLLGNGNALIELDFEGLVGDLQNTPGAIRELGIQLVTDGSDRPVTFTLSGWPSQSWTFERGKEALRYLESRVWAMRWLGAGAGMTAGALLGWELSRRSQTPPSAPAAVSDPHPAGLEETEAARLKLEGIVRTIGDETMKLLIDPYRVVDLAEEVPALQESLWEAGYSGIARLVPTALLPQAQQAPTVTVLVQGTQKEAILRKLAGKVAFTEEVSEANLVIGDADFDLQIKSQYLASRQGPFLEVNKSDVAERITVEFLINLQMGGLFVPGSILFLDRLVAGDFGEAVLVFA